MFHQQQISIWLFMTIQLTASNAMSEPVYIFSPDGDVSVRFATATDGNRENGLFYSILFHERGVIENSKLGFTIDGHSNLYTNWNVQNVERRLVERTNRFVYGEHESVPDRFKEAKISLLHKTSKLQMNLVIRSYNEGVAFRYEAPKQENFQSFTIDSEQTEFRFVDDFFAYEEHGTEGEYHRNRISTIRPRCETPLTVELENGALACVMEAQVTNYPRMWLQPIGNDQAAVQAQLGGKAKINTPFASPWRVVMLAERPGGLVEQNYLLKNLNPPNAIPNPEWIQPGTVIRCTQLNTKGGYSYIDFANAHNIDYVHFDAGWYGPEWEDDSDPRTPKDDLELRSLILYAQERDIGISVYVNRNHLAKYLDELLPLYQKWGIKIMKFGFVKVGKQQEMNWLYNAIKKAAKHKIMIDIHDSYRPSGISRTYPNLMTQEGIRGNEHMPTPEHNVTLPFTRYPAGAGDYTICYYSDRLLTTHAHQLAASVTMFSPLQFLFWYDRPDEYQGEKEIRLFENLPTVWDETKVIDGQIGDYITIARRKGEDWFVASMTDNNARTLRIPFSFLAPNKQYKAKQFFDSYEVNSRTNVGIKTIYVNAKTRLQTVAPAGGGQVFWVRPE